ncbi:Clavaminate synthase-like protein [Meira miltonrushii]|uniref:Clavaminate synthase-like protein n=1 Tax=Meira miltonrushii TaxID=1280837 RepID=A0A316V218_9BASI|nr:Clavaminate synthase-like protein [Meira miltonrushii]PWN31599.1 Clavaminate synthase-like protein [Meira miltonrushii]
MIPSISYTLSSKNFSEALLEAATDYGFFYLTDAPIDWKLVDEAWKSSDNFFLHASQEEKLVSRDREGHTGYTAFQEEKLDPNNTTISQGDFKESFYIAQLSPKPRQTLPPTLEKDHKSLEQLFEACRLICGTILEAFAQSIDLDDQQYFSSKHTAFHDRLRLIHYPPTDVGQEGSSIRAGAHTDYGSITLLFQHQVSGLQVWRENEGKWLDVAPQPHAIVVNVADALEFWTSGVMQSVQHRVVMPRTDDEAVSRFSIAYFCQPDDDAILAPKPLQEHLVKIQRKRSQEQYERELKRKGISSPSARLTGGQHLQSRLKASYT